MKILSAEQIRALDRHTIADEPIASIDLMERAAATLLDALIDGNYIRKTDSIMLFCGMGNNGGDGLALARMLIGQGYLHVTVYVVRHSPMGSPDFELNEKRLKNVSGFHFIETELQIPIIPNNAVIIDAIFGSGLSRPVEGISKSVINHINQSGAEVYSVDVPSGLYCDKVNGSNDTVIKSTVTFTFHAPKLSFMLPASGVYVSQFKVLDIGLNKAYSNNLTSPYWYTTQLYIQSQFKERDKFSHKGTFGHALICSGSYGKMGAAVLSVRAALRSGAGLVSALIPACGYDIMQTSCPEAMVMTWEDDNNISQKKRGALTLDSLSNVDTTKYTSIGVGPGIGTADETVAFLEELLKQCKQLLVVDADALNILSANNKLRDSLPANSILTPHPGEFKRLVGEWADDLEKLDKLKAFAARYNVVVVLKGANTCVASADGTLHFNSTGNAGMAKGGSGDVLTGVITALLAQGYTSLNAAIIGVYIHGLAGDYAAENLGQTGMHAGDIIAYLPKAFKQFE